MINYIAINILLIAALFILITLILIKTNDDNSKKAPEWLIITIVITINIAVIVGVSTLLVLIWT